ncbi:MAG: ParB/RepB/Spo0J family partition protein [Coriobacteriia bacterium]|nr:ParB/RepB/Spo0J family partition protein [Coriobacteriia bacterium]
MAKKSGLGRGLSSLMGETFKEEVIPSKIVPPQKEIKEEPKIRERKAVKEKKESVIEVPITDVVANPNQPRTSFTKQELEELSESIKRNGLLQPILVCKTKNEKYEVIAGERRLRACKMAGLKSIPIIVKQIDENKKLELALIENIQREDLNPMEEAYSYKKLLKEQNVSHAELATIVSKARSTITNSLRLLELPEDAQELLYKNIITAGHARAILSVKSNESRDKLIDKIVNENLSVRESERIAALLNNQSMKALTTARPITPKSYKKAAKVLKDYLGNQTKVKKTKDKNKIEIEFKDERDLERILNLIVNDN